MAAPGVSTATEEAIATLETWKAGNPVNQIWQEDADFQYLSSIIKSRKGRTFKVAIVGGTAAEGEFSAGRSAAYTPTAGNDLLGAAEYAWSQPLISQIYTTFLDDEDNQGPEAQVDRAALQVDAVLRAQKAQISTILNTADGSLATGSFVGWDTLTNPNVTSVGGIDSADSGNEFWEPYGRDCTGLSDPEKIFRKAATDFRKTTGGLVPVDAMCGLNMWDLVQDWLIAHNLGQMLGGSVSVGFQNVTIWGWNIRFNPATPDAKVFLLDKNSIDAAYQNDKFLKVGKTIQVQKIVSGVLKVTQDESTPVLSRIAIGANRRNTLGQLFDVG